MRLLLSNCKSVIVLSPGWNYAPSPSPPFQPLVPESFWNSLSIQVIKVNPRGREREREKEFFSQWEKRGKLIGRHARSNLIVNCFGNKSRTNIEGGGGESARWIRIPAERSILTRGKRFEISRISSAEYLSKWFII